MPQDDEYTSFQSQILSLENYIIASSFKTLWKNKIKQMCSSFSINLFTQVYFLPDLS